MAFITEGISEKSTTLPTLSVRNSTVAVFKLATTGTPQAKASNTTIPKDSNSEGFTKTSNLEYISAICSGELTYLSSFIPFSVFVPTFPTRVISQSGRVDASWLKKLTFLPISQFRATPRILILPSFWGVPLGLNMPISTPFGMTKHF